MPQTRPDRRKGLECGPQVGRGDEVVKTCLAGGGVLDAPRHPRAAGADVAQGLGHRVDAYSFEHQVRREVARPDDGAVAEPSQRDLDPNRRQGSGVAVVGTVHREADATGRRGEVGVYADRLVKVEVSEVRQVGGRD